MSSYKQKYRFILLTNDFPPKVGGIQSYLWELFKRLDPQSYLVITTKYRNSTDFDRSKNVPKIIRLNTKLITPTPVVLRIVANQIQKYQCNFLIIDPLVPTGVIGYRLKKMMAVNYGVILHGAEATIPTKLFYLRRWSLRVLESASFIIAAGNFVIDKTLENLASVTSFKVIQDIKTKTDVITPGVDVNKFHPVNRATKLRLRQELGVSQDDFILLGVSRLVPRKGFDIAIRAVGELNKTNQKLKLIIAGFGKDYLRLRIIASLSKAKVVFLKRVSEEKLIELYQCADCFIMLCKDRFFSLEQEGFGIVFLEAQATGLPQIAGLSGGSNEAVQDNLTGLVLKNPRSVSEAVGCIKRVLDDPVILEHFSIESVKRARECFSYETLADKLKKVLDRNLVNTNSEE